MQRVFLDNNGTTQIDPRVAAAVMEELEMGPSNPSSIHSFGREAHQRLSKARESIASYLQVQPSELIFTSSGTEALNLALLGLKPKGSIISSKIEHAAVHNTLTNMDNPITYLPVGKEGHVHAVDLRNAISNETGLIVLSAVNSETGVKNPIDEIAKIAQQYEVPLIVDGVASLGKEPVTIPHGVTAMAFSGHKIHAPKGVGLLFLRKGTKLAPQLTGGGQEAMRRAGTENLPGIIGLAKAISLIDPSTFSEMARLRDLLEKSLDGVIVNGTGPRVCNTSSVTFPGMDGESLLIQLDMQGIAASMGSACSSGALEASRVLLDMGISREDALSTIRFSLSRFTTEEEILQLIKMVPPLQMR